MNPDTVQVMVRVVAVGEVTRRLVTGPGGTAVVNGGGEGMVRREGGGGGGKRNIVEQGNCSGVLGTLASCHLLKGE